MRFVPTIRLVPSIALFAILFLGLPSHGFADIVVHITSEDSKKRLFRLIIEGINSSANEPVKVVNRIDDTLTDQDKAIFLGDDIIAASLDELPEIQSPLIVAGLVKSYSETSSFTRLPVQIDIGFALDQIAKTGTNPRTIHTVTTATSEIYINQASDSLTARGINLNHIRANSIKETARAWFDVLLDVDAERDAIWISDPAFLDESRSLRYILEQAWKRDVLVFTTVPSLADRGVAIGFIPNLENYGSSIVDAFDLAAGSVVYLNSNSVLRRVFNKRSLLHVGRRLPSDTDRRGFEDLVIDD